MAHRIKLIAAALAAACATPLAAAPAGYHVAGSIAGPDGAGWDYAQVDPRQRLLFVAHGDAITVVDLAHGNKVSSLGAIHHGHGVVPVPGTHRLAVTSGGDSTVRVFDLSTRAELFSLPVDQDPDAALIDPANGHLLVMNAKAGTIAEIDVGAGRLVRTIKAKPALEYAAIGAGRLLYVNDEDLNEVEVIDLRRGSVVGSIAMPGCEAPSGLALDAAHQRLVSACANGQAAIVDLRTRRLAQLVPIGHGPDAVILDAARGVALIPCGKDGVLDVLAIDKPGRVERRAEIATEVGARTGTLDPATGTVYLPTAKAGPMPAGGGRPSPLPGSFHLLVVKPS